VDKYTWVELGSSYLPSELIAAFLWAQLEQADDINPRRLDIWHSYHQQFAALEKQGKLRRPVIPADCQHNAHMYYLLLPDLQQRSAFINSLKQHGIGAVFHYVPLHSSPMGRQFGRMSGKLKNTDELSDRLVRLPMWLGLEEELDDVIQLIINILDSGMDKPDRRMK